MYETHNESRRRLLLSALLLIVVVSGAFYFIDRLQDNEFVLALIGSFGYLGVYLTALASGLSAIVPVPPGVLTPLFETAGLSLVLIIIFLSLGTLTADIFGFYLGNFNSSFVQKKAPRTYAWFRNLYTEKPYLVLPVVFSYIAFAPLPNELVVITLGALGYRMRSLVLPLFFGSILHHTLIAFGARGAFELIF